MSYPVFDGPEYVLTSSSDLTPRAMFIEHGVFLREDAHNLQAVRPLYWVSVFIDNEPRQFAEIMRQLMYKIEARRDVYVTTENLHRTYRNCISLAVIGESNINIVLQSAENHARRIQLEAQFSNVEINWAYFHHGVTLFDKPLRKESILLAPQNPTFFRRRFVR
jgi:hypothetical protein